MCGQAGICQITLFVVPFFQSTIVEHLQIILDDEWNDIIFQAFLKHNQSANTTISVPYLNISQTLFFFVWVPLKLAQINKVIQRLCTPPEIIMSTVNRTSTARTSFEIVNGNGLNNVSTNLTLDCISDNSHNITP